MLSHDTKWGFDSMSVCRFKQLARQPNIRIGLLLVALKVYQSEIEFGPQRTRTTLELVDFVDVIGPSSDSHNDWKTWSTWLERSVSRNLATMHWTLLVHLVVKGGYSQARDGERCRGL